MTEAQENERTWLSHNWFWLVKLHPNVKRVARIFLSNSQSWIEQSWITVCIQIKNWTAKKNIAIQCGLEQ